MRRLTFVVAGLIAVAGSARAQTAITRRAVEVSLDSLMQAYAKAFEGREADRVVAFYAPGSETSVWRDGKLYTYAQNAAALRGFIGASHDIVIRYEEVKAHAITNDVGAIWTTLRETWKDATGKESTVRVVASWVARRSGTNWQFTYVDGRHATVAPDSTRRP